MAGVPKWKKEQEKGRLPTDYSPSNEEQKAYEYCLDNDIRISPWYHSQGKWYIGISTPEDYKKVYKSKHVYDKDTIWFSFYDMCKFYYNKRK